MINNIDEIKTFTENLAKSAGKILLSERKNITVVNQKDVCDVATNADIAAEKFIIAEIQKKYPSHAIYSEEVGEIAADSEFKWIIDPLDGTKAYYRNLPNFSCNICLTQNGNPIVGVVYCPETDRLYSAAIGLGSSLNGFKLKLSAVTDFDKVYVCVYLPTKNRKVIDYEKSWDIIRSLAGKVYRIQSEASISLALCYLANGAWEVYLDLSNPPHWHDVAPGLIIAQEAGVIIKDVKGNDIKNGSVETLVAANNETVYNKIAEIIK